MRNYLRVNKSLTQSIIDSDRLVLLIDNFKAKDGFSVCLRSFIQTHENCTVFITAEDNLNNSLDIEGLDYCMEINKKITPCRLLKKEFNNFFYKIKYGSTMFPLFFFKKIFINDYPDTNFTIMQIYHIL